MHDERIRFFHRTAPWIAVQATETAPPYEILVLRRNSYDLEADVTAAFPLSMLNRIFFELDQAVGLIEKWLLEEVQRVEKATS